LIKKSEAHSSPFLRGQAASLPVRQPVFSERDESIGDDAWDTRPSHFGLQYTPCSDLSCALPSHGSHSIFVARLDTRTSFLIGHP
jgi:hypothetical protein